ncbi:MAG: hypothetical protein ABFS56_18360 [Pseudomonadota bacterium]
MMFRHVVPEYVKIAYFKPYSSYKANHKFEQAYKFYGILIFKVEIAAQYGIDPRAVIFGYC